MIARNVFETRFSTHAGSQEFLCVSSCTHGPDHVRRKILRRPGNDRLDELTCDIWPPDIVNKSHGGSISIGESHPN